MNWVDYAILGVVLVSAVVSLLRGFIKEALSLTGWIVAIWVALAFASRLSEMLAGLISSPSLRIVVAFTILFIVTLVLAALVNFFASQLVKRTGLTGTDRVLGMFFGILRGAVIVAVLVLFAGLSTVPQESWWRGSLLIPHFQGLAIFLRDLLPADVARHFVY